jgi:predicted O-linked N-acetylglucosamine transferase (SPINDLY family)
MIDLQLELNQQLVDSIEVLGARALEHLHHARNLAASGRAWKWVTAPNDGSFVQGDPDSAPIRWRTGANYLYTLLAMTASLPPNRWTALGRDRLAQGRPGEAARCFETALALAPADPYVLNDLGIALKSQGSPADAARIYRRALAVDADDPGPLNNLANALAAAGDQTGASTVFKLLAGRAPWLVEGHQNRAENLRHLGRLDEALPCLRAAIALRPDFAPSHRSLAVLSLSLGEIPSAVANYRRTLILAPSAAIHSVLLSVMAYDAATTNRSLYAEHLRWSTLYAGRTRGTLAPAVRDIGADGRLRVGYVSADLREHPVARNIIGLICAHDRRRFEIFLYPEIIARDAVTERFRVLADEWRPTQGLSDDAVANLIRQDRIDILVFVAGHTGSSRIAIATQRAAPVQAAMYGFSTTGMEEVDAWFTDPVLHPPGSTERFVEKLTFLPSFFLFEPPPRLAFAPPASHLLTFGSFNNPAKHTPEVYRLWARLLADIPDSRLRLKYLKAYDVPSLRRRIIDTFARHGVGPDRLDFLTTIDAREDHLTELARLDIALDPFPFNGCNTTFEALWMGVPVVTMAGERFLSRMGASLLAQIGLPDLIATDEAAYLRIAKILAADSSRRTALRSELRTRVACSKLCDRSAYALSVEEACLELWRSKKGAAAC